MATLSKKPSVVLADDHHGMMKKIVEILGQDVLIVCEASDGMSAIEAALKYNPDILVLDITMPKCNGLQAAYEVRRRGSACKIIFLTVQEDIDYVEAAAGIGAGYVLKAKMCTDLPLAIRKTLSGGIFISAFPKVMPSQTK